MGCVVLLGGIAATAEGAGGQVNTGGKITFYEATSESEERPEESTPEPPGDNTPSENGDQSNPQKKPSENLPNMGDVVKYFSFIGIILLILVWLIRKKTKEEG